MIEPYDPLPDLAELTRLCVQRTTTQRHGTANQLRAVLLRLLDGLEVEPARAREHAAWLEAFRTASVQDNRQVTASS